MEELGKKTQKKTGEDGAKKRAMRMVE